jgi:hypothetical protein
MKIKNFFFLALLVSCAIRKDLETPFENPENKAKVDQGGDGDPTHGTTFCKLQPDGTFNPKTILLQSSITSDGNAVAIGGGCVMRPIREIWAVLNNLEIMKFEDADSFKAKSIAHSSEFIRAYEITYFKSTVVGEIDWTILWYHGIGKGNFENPESLNINYQRSRGTSNIPVWKGGIVLTKVNDTVTSISVRNEFKARQSKGENVTSARDAIAEIIGHARDGAPDWKRLENDTSVKQPQITEPPTSVQRTSFKPGLKIECTVGDPKTLADVFDLKKGDKIQSEAKGDKTDVTINGAEGLKDFPFKLELNKKNSKFKVEGQIERHNGILKFKMLGQLAGKGSISFKYGSNNKEGTHMQGTAQLDGCHSGNQAMVYNAQ